MQGMNKEDTTKIIESEFEKEVIPNLSEYIKIPNISPAFDLEWNTNGFLEKAAEFLNGWVLSQNVQGLKSEVIKQENLTPVVFIEIEGNVQQNVFIYGHFDKQPHFTGWAEGLGPCIPVLKGDWLYGRGASDDGYAIFSAITAIKAIKAQGGKHGRICILIEGSEESGSPHLSSYIDLLKPRIGKPDIFFCLDSGCGTYDSLWVTSSIRGCVMVDFTVTTLKVGVHSGAGSGFVPDSFMVLRNLLDRIENSQTGEVHKDLHVEIPEVRMKEIETVASVLKDELFAQVTFEDGVKKLNEDYVKAVLHNTWQPTLVVTGMTGFPEAKVAGNLIRTQTTARISIRLPPTLDAEKAKSILSDLLTKDVPYNSKVTIDGMRGMPGWNNKEYSSKLTNILNNNSKLFYGDDKEAYIYGMGGSIPFLNQLAVSFPECEMIATGVLGPFSNAHSVDEALHVPYCKKVTCAIAHIISDYACN